MTDQNTTRTPAWPRLRLADWTATMDTLHMWTQIVGKVRMAHAPMVNHWWHVTLYVSPRGLTTSAIPYRDGAFDIEFDFVDHELHIRTSDGRRGDVALAPKPVARAMGDCAIQAWSGSVRPLSAIRPASSHEKEAAQAL